jgi:hypothetical protein
VRDADWHPIYKFNADSLSEFVAMHKFGYVTRSFVEIADEQRCPEE